MSKVQETWKAYKQTRVMLMIKYGSMQNAVQSLWHNKEGFDALTEIGRDIIASHRELYKPTPEELREMVERHRARKKKEREAKGFYES